jgi:prephenate dehydrogenase
MGEELGAGPFRNVGIVGLGLVGGSVARDLKALPDPPFLRALSKDPEDIDRAVQDGVLDEGQDGPEGFFRDLDLLVFATPLGVTLELLERYASALEPATVITDVASLKAPVLGAANAAGLGGRYVGSHPMAGGEKSGYGASRSGIFQDARVWLVADEAPEDIRARVEGFWTALGAKATWTDAVEHDVRMAWVSHLPQFVSNALAMALEGNGVARGDLGPGGMDMTRLAGSQPEMWVDLVAHGSDGLSQALESMEGALGRIRALVSEGRLEEVKGVMDRNRAWWSGRDPWS